MNPTSATCKLLRSRILDEVLLIVAGAEAGLDVAREQCFAALDMFSDRHLLQRIQNSNNLLHAITWKDFGGASKPPAEVHRIVNCARIMQGDLPPDRLSLDADWSDSRSWLRRHPQRMTDRAQSWGLKQLVHIVLGPFVTASVIARDVVSEAFQDPALSPEKVERYSRVAAILSAACRIIISATLSVDLTQLEKRVQYLRRAERFAAARSHGRKISSLGSSVKAPAANSRFMSYEIRRSSDLSRRSSLGSADTNRRKKEDSTALLSEQAGPDRARPKPETPLRKLERPVLAAKEELSTSPRASPSERGGARQQELDFGLPQHASIVAKNLNYSHSSRYAPPHRISATMPSLDISRVSHPSSAATSARGELPSRSPQPQGGPSSRVKLQSPRSAGSPRSYLWKPPVSTEDLVQCARRDTLRRRSKSPDLPPSIAAPPLDLLNWAKEAALADDRSAEVASLLHKEAFVFNEVRRAAPEQLLASLMGVSGLKAGECLALTNAMSRLMLDSKDPLEGKAMSSN